MYGLSREKYFEILNEQGGLCAICGEDNGARPLFVDHDHETMKVRGLLCNRCNSLIGVLEVRREITDRALDYLIKHQQVNEIENSKT